MQPSEMTNERIAEELIATIPHLSDEAWSCTDADDILREAAARLRRIDTYKEINERQDKDNADRIEAAMNQPVTDCNHLGNAAKMRDALRQVSRVAVEMTRKTVTGESEDRKTVDEWALRLCDIVSATLAAPPRNCDVGTDEEQSRRYEELCDRHTCGSRCSASGCPMYEHDCSPFAWGQMPYEEGGAK